MALVGQISWDSLFSDVGRMSVVTKSGYCLGGFVTGWRENIIQRTLAP